MRASHLERTAAGNAFSPASQRQTVRGSRVSTSAAKRLTERPDALIAALKSSLSVMGCLVDGDAPDFEAVACGAVHHRVKPLVADADVAPDCGDLGDAPLGGDRCGHA